MGERGEVRGSGLVEAKPGLKMLHEPKIEAYLCHKVC